MRNRNDPGKEKRGESRPENRSRIAGPGRRFGDDERGERRPEGRGRATGITRRFADDERGERRSEERGRTAGAGRRFADNDKEERRPESRGRNTGIPRRFPDNERGERRSEDRDRNTGTGRRFSGDDREERRPESRGRNTGVTRRFPDNERGERRSEERGRTAGAGRRFADNDREERRPGRTRERRDADEPRPFDTPGRRFSGEAPRTSSRENRESRYEKPYSRPDSDERRAPADSPASDGLIRLNRFIANAGICSRREADELISTGQITVNGKVVSEMGFRVKPSDVVKYGKRVLNAERLVYILLNKPKDYITTTEDPEDRKTVLQLIEGACEERVYPVGRLDRNTTGLLLITNDGELADKLTHPSHNIRKIYQAELDKPISLEDFEALKEGVELEDGFIRPDDVAIVTPDAYVVGIEIHSGRNRIVRRLFEHLGYEVKKLDRTTFAGLNKKDLPRGKWRLLTQKEVVMLKFLT